MKAKATAAVVAIFIGGLLAGGLAGTAIAGVTAPATDSQGRVISEALAEETKFPTNEAGETFGRGDLPTLPDLIQAVGDDGTEGYVRDSELYPPITGTPEENAERQAERYQVPLYESDGKTVIGTFTVQEGYSGSEEPRG